MKFSSYHKRWLFYYGKCYLLWATPVQDILIKEKIEKTVNTNFQFTKMEWNILY